MRSPTRLACALALLPLMACVSLPATPAERGLYMDLRKSVEMKQKTGGWVVDRIEVESQASAALRSFCQADDVARERLELWLEAERIRAGGSARAIYERTGDLADASEVLTIERVQRLLQYAKEHAREDCPFWMHADPEFAGVEGNAERLVLWFESIGGGALVIEGSEAALGGGGGGRVLVAHGIGARLSLAVGAEIGGAGAFVKNDRGGRSIDTTFTAAIPWVLRVTDVSRVYDFELAPLVHFDPGQAVLPPGLRAAVGYGLTAMRGSAFMPYIVIWTGYEIYPARDGNPAQHSIRIGTRVGVDFDP